MGKTAKAPTVKSRRVIVPPDGVSELEGAILVEAQVLVGILRRKAREVSEDASGQKNGLAKAESP